MQEAVRTHIMDKTLQGLIEDVCKGFPSPDVEVTNVFDERRFARMAHYAWKHELGFNPKMFKDALKETPNFQRLSEDALEKKANELCLQACFAKAMFHAAFDLENLSI